MEVAEEVINLIDAAIEEDIGSGDATTLSCIPEDARISGKLILKQAGVIAGLPFIEQIFNKIDPSVHVNILVEEGSFLKAGTTLAEIEGSARSILSGERIMLNLIQHASGVATITRAYVKKVAGHQCAILDTRKTLPGLRALEKYGVRVGGGINHRFGLYDRIVIKLKHLFFVASQTKSPILEAVAQAKAMYPELPVEIEIDKTQNIEQALKSGADAIILINMSPDDIKKSTAKIKKNSHKKVYVESASAITLDTIRAFAETGVDGISLSVITHSIEDLDIRFRHSS